MTRAATQAERWDRSRDYAKHEPNPYADQRLVVASLVGECESIVSSGVLTEPAEQSLRLLIARTLAVYGMPSRAERTR
jgi:hypothetical protein